MLPIPHGIHANFSELDPKKLKEKGVRFVLADLDNTLASYGETHPSPQAIAWKKALDQEDITLFILSNSRKKGRVDVYAAALSVPFQAWSGKPKKKGYKSALATLQAQPQECLMVGDQIFTDILGASRMGIPSILVHPIQFANLGQKVRYHILETPFRQAGKKNIFIQP